MVAMAFMRYITDVAVAAAIPAVEDVVAVGEGATAAEVKVGIEVAVEVSVVIVIEAEMAVTVDVVGGEEGIGVVAMVLKSVAALGKARQPSASRACAFTPLLFA